MTHKYPFISINDNYIILHTSLSKSVGVIYYNMEYNSFHFLSDPFVPSPFSRITSNIYRECGTNSPVMYDQLSLFLSHIYNMEWSNKAVYKAVYDTSSHHIINLCNTYSLVLSHFRDITYIRLHYRNLLKPNFLSSKKKRKIIHKITKQVYKKIPTGHIIKEVIEKYDS